jgi:hypothetical protein
MKTDTSTNYLMKRASYSTQDTSMTFSSPTTNRTTPKKIHDYLNNLHPSLEFTPTVEENNRINFLDLLITRQPSATEIDIYRKPTATDTTINYTSNYLTEHKLAVYHYLMTYRMAAEEK